MAQELWKPIENYEGEYLVSNKGRVKSIKTPYETLLKPKERVKKGLQVTLYKGKKSKAYYIDDLVNQAFYPNRKIYKCDKCGKELLKEKPIRLVRQKYGAGTYKQYYQIGRHDLCSKCIAKFDKWLEN